MAKILCDLYRLGSSVNIAGSEAVLHFLAGWFTREVKGNRREIDALLPASSTLEKLINTVLEVPVITRLSSLEFFSYHILVMNTSGR